MEKRDYASASISYGETYAGFKELSAKGTTLPDGVHYRAIESLAKLAYCLKWLKKGKESCLSLNQFYKESAVLPHNIRLFALDMREQLKCSKK